MRLRLEKSQERSALLCEPHGARATLQRHSHSLSDGGTSVFFGLPTWYFCEKHTLPFESTTRKTNWVLRSSSHHQSNDSSVVEVRICCRTLSGESGLTAAASCQLQAPQEVLASHAPLTKNGARPPVRLRLTGSPCETTRPFRLEQFGAVDEAQVSCEA